ncbi:uncharacterized protein LOC131939728 [Physella acuta]|uniref:uncharacterized protein LOC131939728 n=1 Tax=Physella acuta TaxID=109671 RepID=UPI0027DDA74B|nr:uncharacterized protein LOC131939728 [Physella acuta]XP_059154193.1 uncharacterized protein LOC131939728 [Physella acuta]XP_059154194.1 uncharacterized protein LOC131939728 [Physella acuta]XP_059154195.1 uncharacterized protein LOC131939728 [Physella acuta]
MDNSVLLSIVEYATIGVSFIMMGSGVPGCVKMYKTKETKNVPLSMYLIFALINLLSLQYGKLLQNSTLILINVVGLSVWGTCIFIYILVSNPKTTPLLKLFTLIGLYMSKMYYLSIIPQTEVVPTLGSYLMFWCIMLSVIPVLEIIKIVSERSATCCDKSIMFGATLSASVWCSYGVLISDINIYAPNFLGLVINGIKIILVFVFGTQSKSIHID